MDIDSLRQSMRYPRTAEICGGVPSTAVDLIRKLKFSRDAARAVYGRGLLADLPGVRLLLTPESGGLVLYTAEPGSTNFTGRTGPLTGQRLYAELISIVEQTA